MTIAVLLVDDHSVVRRGLRSLLESEPDLTIVGEAKDGLEALRLVEHTHTDVMLLDLMLPDISGLEVLRVLRERGTPTRVVVISMHSNNVHVAEALKNGAIGYVLKDCTETCIIESVRAAAAGKRYLSPLVTNIAINAYIKQAVEGPFDPHDTLTPREREVLQFTAQGYTSCLIAKSLHISSRTVENHRAHLMRKLRLENLADLIRYALQRGLIPMDV